MSGTLDPPLDLADLDLTGLSRADVLDALLEAALAGAPEDEPDAHLPDQTDAPFDAANQPRDHRGRFSPAERARVRTIVGDYLKASHPPSARETGTLVGHLSRLTVKDLHALRAEHGLQGSRLRKADLVAALQKRFAARRGPREEVGMSAEVAFATADTGDQDGDYVVRHAPVVFKAGDYDFPAEDGGPFTMTPEDIKQALSDFKPVPIGDNHRPQSFFDGQLGEFVEAVPAGDFASFGGKLRIPRWLDNLYKGSAIRLSATWDRVSKRLKNVALTHTPRITEAAMFAAFSADPAFARNIQVTPHGKSRLQAIHDMSATAGAVCKPGTAAMSAVGQLQKTLVQLRGDAPDADFTSSAEHKALQAIHDTTTGLGAQCSLYDPEDLKRGGAMGGVMAAYTTETTAPTAREKELERQLAEFRQKHEQQEAQFAERLAGLEKANQEAAFNASLAQFQADAQAFVQAQAKRLYGKRDRDAVATMYVQCARAHLLNPTQEVQFSNDKGEAVKGTLLDAFRASVLARPETQLQGEHLAGPLQVLFAQDPPSPEDAETARLKTAMEERVRRQNERNGRQRPAQTQTHAG